MTGDLDTLPPGEAALYVLAAFVSLGIVALVIAFIPDMMAKGAEWRERWEMHMRWRRTRRNGRGKR